MAIIKTLNILLRGNTERLKKDYQKAEGETRQFSQRVSKISASGFLSGFAGAAGAIGLTKALGSVSNMMLGAAKSGVILAAENEKAAIGFEVLTGSAKMAADTIKRLEDFATSTPFEQDEIRNAGKKLLAAGVSVDQLTDKLNLLGDASAAVDANLNEVVQIYSKIRNQNKLTGETFEQLAERSINLGPVLQEVLGVSADKFLKLRAAGKITADDVDKAFDKMNDGGGMFFGAMDKLGRTLIGRFNTMVDKVRILTRGFGDELLPQLKKIVENMIPLFESTNIASQAFTLLGSAVAGFLKYLNIAVVGVRYLSDQIQLFVQALSPLFTIIGGIADQVERMLGNVAMPIKAFRDAVTVFDILQGGANAAGDDIDKLIDKLNKVGETQSQKTQFGSAAFGSAEAVKTLFGVKPSTQQIDPADQAQIDLQRQQLKALNQIKEGLHNFGPRIFTQGAFGGG